MSSLPKRPRHLMGWSGWNVTRPGRLTVELQGAVATHEAQTWGRMPRSVCVLRGTCSVCRCRSSALLSAPPPTNPSAPPYLHLILGCECEGPTALARLPSISRPSSTHGSHLCAIIPALEWYHTCCIERTACQPVHEGCTSGGY
eukprot:366012-Chlamydomonas_euryale.AAC.2